MKYIAYFLFAISLVGPVNWGLASRSFCNVEAQQPECLLCHESSFVDNEFIMPWDHAFPGCSGDHERGYVCSICVRALSHQGIICPLCARQATDEISNGAIEELLVNQSSHQARRLARFNRQGRARQRETELDQEEPSR